jgi:Glycosyltransferase family 87
MTKARIDGLCLLFLGASVVLLLTGWLLKAGSTSSFQDFRSDYYSSQCLIQHCDPYKEGDVLRLLQREGGSNPSETELDRQIATRYVYPPTAFALMFPFSLAPWGIAHLFWMVVSNLCFLVAALLAWDLAADFAPVVSGVLIGFLLANSEVIVVLSNPSGIVIGLCVIAVWCFLRNRFVPIGVLCFAVSLVVKPQDPGLIWLYFLLAGGVLRKRALQTLLVAILISLPFVLWVWHVSPNWIEELRSNLLAFSVHGGLNDPGPASQSAHQLVDLPVVLSLIRDNPNFYNPISYLIVAPFLLIWALIAVRTSHSRRNVWLALATVVPLLLLPVHHHLYDVKLLMLTVPAVAMLWAEGKLIGRFALLGTSAVLVLTGDVSNAVLRGIAHGLHATDQLARAISVYSIPPVLLLLGAFYLWIYARYSFRSEGKRQFAEEELAQIPPVAAS